MSDKSNPHTSSLRNFTDSLTATVYMQEKTYGGVIASTLDKLHEKGLSPEQMAPTLDEIVENLALSILEGKGGFVNNKR